MSVEAKLAAAIGMSNTVRQLAWAGVQRRHPNAGPREVFLRVAMLTLGPELARTAYPEIAALDPD